MINIVLKGFWYPVLYSDWYPMLLFESSLSSAFWNVLSYSVIRAYSVSDFDKCTALFHYFSLLCYLELQSTPSGIILCMRLANERGISGWLSAYTEWSLLHSISHKMLTYSTWTVGCNCQLWQSRTWPNLTIQCKQLNLYPDMNTHKLDLNLTHCGLVTPYGDRGLGQHWLR